MSLEYTAKVFVDENEIASESGSDIDELYNWMLIKAQGKFGNIHGQVIDNKTGKIIRCFRKAPPD